VRCLKNLRRLRTAARPSRQMSVSGQRSRRTRGVAS
jgi:hypothetical protein